MNPIPQPHRPPSAQNSAWPIPAASPLLSSHSMFTSTHPQRLTQLQLRPLPPSVPPAPSLRAPGTGWTLQLLAPRLGGTALSSPL